jgi:ferritin-like metal-binding protein YciE
MLNEYNTLNQRLNDHITSCETRFTDGDRKFQELIQCTKANTEATNRLVAETAEVVSLYKDAQSVIRAGVIAQKFGIWIIKWPLIGVGILGILKWIRDNAS